MNLPFVLNVEFSKKFHLVFSLSRQSHGINTRPGHPNVKLSSVYKVINTVSVILWFSELGSEVTASKLFLSYEKQFFTAKRG